MAEVAAAVAAALQGVLNRQNQPFFRVWEVCPLTGDLAQDVSKWFENFEYQADLVTDISDAIRLVELRKSLRDRALNVYQAADAQAVSTYSLSKGYLQGHLAYPHQVAIWRQKFHDRKKHDDETVADYLRDLRILVKHAYSSEAEAARLLVLKERFINGLIVTDKTHSNYKLWKAAYMNLSKTLDEIVSAASTAEMTQRMVSLTTAINDVSSNVTAVLTDQVMPTIAQGYDAHVQRNGRQPHTHVTATRQWQQKSQLEDQYNGTSVLCVYCGVDGHTIDQCLYMAWARQRAANFDGQSTCTHCGNNNHSKYSCRYYMAAKRRLSGQEPRQLDTAVSDDSSFAMRSIQQYDGHNNRNRNGKKGNSNRVSLKDLPSRGCPQDKSSNYSAEGPMVEGDGFFFPEDYHLFEGSLFEGQQVGNNAHKERREQYNTHYRSKKKKNESQMQHTLECLLSEFRVLRELLTTYLQDKQRLETNPRSVRPQSKNMPPQRKRSKGRTFWRSQHASSVHNQEHANRQFPSSSTNGTHGFGNIECTHHDNVSAPILREVTDHMVTTSLVDRLAENLQQALRGEYPIERDHVDNMDGAVSTQKYGDDDDDAFYSADEENNEQPSPTNSKAQPISSLVQYNESLDQEELEATVSTGSGSLQEQESIVPAAEPGSSAPVAHPPLDVSAMKVESQQTAWSTSAHFEYEEYTEYPYNGEYGDVVDNYAKYFSEQQSCSDCFHTCTHQEGMIPPSIAGDHTAERKDAKAMRAHLDFYRAGDQPSGYDEGIEDIFDTYVNDFSEGRAPDDCFETIGYPEQPVATSQAINWDKSAVLKKKRKRNKNRNKW